MDTPAAIPRAGDYRKSDSQNSTPQRRSIADLQLLVDEIFHARLSASQGPSSSSSSDSSTKTCKCADLPALLADFERRKSITLLDDDEKVQLQAFADANPDLAVSSVELVAVLGSLQAAPSSPTPDSKSLPPIPTDDDLTIRNRTISTSSSSSGHSHDSTMLTGRGTLTSPTPDPPVFPRSLSMPDELGMSPLFSPATSIADSERHRARTASPEVHKTASSLPNRPLHPHSKSNQNTPILSGMSNASSSIFARQRSSPLEVDSFRRARPNKSRRTSSDFTKNSRQSSEEPISPYEQSASPAYQPLDTMQEEHSSQFANYPQNRSRQSSDRSNRAMSPVLGMGTPHAGTTQHMLDPPLFSPTSPKIEKRSFYPRPPSPGDDDDHEGDSTFSHQLTRPVSMASLASEAAMSEMIQQLQQELSRKTADLESQKADGYAALLDKEALLEEARAELAAKRREEKELRSKEKLNLHQIATLEAQTATFRDERDKQKAAHQTARKQFEEQCHESEKLRDVIRDKDEELRLAEEQSQASASDLAKALRERDYLQSSVKRLESELHDAKELVESLEQQRQDNVSLKETIDRLRLELDELRAQARLQESFKGGASLSRSTSGSESMSGTLSRNLGRELAIKLLDTGETSSRNESEGLSREPSSDSYEEEIITTRRRLKRPVKRIDTITPATVTKADPEITLQAVEVVDIGLQVDARPECVDTCVSTDVEEPPSREEKRAALARDLSVDLDAVEQYVRDKQQREALSRSVPDSAPPSYHQATSGWYSHVPYAPRVMNFLGSEPDTIFGFVLKSSGNLVLFSICIYITGVLTGAILSPVHHYHHGVPYGGLASWVAANTAEGLPLQYGGWLERVSFVLQRLAWRSVAVARRTPY